MEYERIEKVQAGIISPSKLRMKLLGPHHHRKKDGSNSNSSRTSPSRLEDAEFVNSLLASKNDNLEDEVTSPSLEVLSLKPSSDAVVDRKQSGKISHEAKETIAKENGETGRVKMQHFQKVVGSGSSSTIHALRSVEDENLDYDSNASSSSFEFDKGERPGNNPATRSLFRPIPSKWNDAEKWIMNRQNIHANHSKKHVAHNQANRMASSMVRVAPESAHYDHKLPTVSGQAHGANPVVESFPQSKDLKEVNELVLSSSRGTDDQSVMPGIRSVAMRDMGTEMTPVPSQEPSRTATPVGSATPLRSPVSSMPSTPRRGAPASTPLDNMTDEDSQFPVENGRRHLSEEEMKIKTRREIAALGVQLGKMNIAAWASKDEQEKNQSSLQGTNMQEQERIEFEKRAAMWEEAEKSKHTARFKREEIKIQAWESEQKAKLEAEMRRTEAKVEQIRAQTHAKMVKKIAMARQRSEEKRAAAEARKNREAERTVAQAEYIRQTGRLPSSSYICCGWL
ncbi:uncharacterized protein LOC108323747 isoform X3 [Vigna angularis]|uniref:uncharacterized protein LOC108323747 isoform X3 n=1 Tax=Phaseolus angularis TaxID=3914 RepID=UPI00080A56A8|nr:uncharacterized protein LOC108323747 isoform X3 [Vigna angularis]